MRLVRFLSTGIYRDTLVAAGTELMIDDSTVLSKHMLDVATGERGGVALPVPGSTDALPRMADVMRQVGTMFPRMVGKDGTVYAYKADENTFLPERNLALAPVAADDVATAPAADEAPLEPAAPPEPTSSIAAPPARTPAPEPVELNLTEAGTAPAPQTEPRSGDITPQGAPA